ncbi:MAG: FG-GAP repeat domain-containing protein, partial [Planctomycetota bacterium]
VEAGSYLVRVYSGSGGATLFVFPGFGGVAGLGDIDGDGFGEIAVGDMTVDSSPTAIDAGAVTIHSGQTGATLQTFLGWSSYQVLGAAVAAAGDLNGDGTPDVIAGAPTLYPFLATTNAYVQVYSGTGGAPLLSLTSLFGSDRLGAAVAGGSDVTGDGVPDILAGGPASVNNTGIAHLFSGSTGAVFFTLIVPGFPSSWGSSVGLPGDVDGDGSNDMLVGGPGTFAGQPTLGRVTIYSGASGLEILNITNASVPAGFAQSAAPAGDVNGDGFPDVVIGSVGAGNQGTVFVYSGAPVGVAPFGMGCSGSSGTPPRIGATGAPAIGATFSLHVSSASGGTVAALLIGASNTTWYGIPLPLDLSFLGLPACSLLVSPDFAVFAPTIGVGPTAGHATVGGVIPGNAALLGQSVFAQWFVVEPGFGPPPVVFTRGVQVTFQ